MLFQVPVQCSLFLRGHAQLILNVLWEAATKYPSGLDKISNPLGMHRFHCGIYFQARRYNIV